MEGVTVLPGGNKTHPRVPMTREKMEELYPDVEAKCAVWLFPYTALESFEPYLYSAGRSYPHMGENRRYIYNIVKHVRRPRTQRIFVKDFVENTMKNKKYIGNVLAPSNFSLHRIVSVVSRSYNVRYSVILLKT